MNLSAIPTNIITGFLGVGKTTAISQLLQSKPKNERWAVLVNEFGEVGIDGSFFTGKHGKEDGVFIREVPGGCMCCASGMPMQIALNMLLARAKPQRLIIEPTGLGHPKEVVATLSSQYYRDVIQLNKIITLVDARKIVDARYTQHETFNEQLEIADIIVAHKSDQYDGEDLARLKSFLSGKKETPFTPIYSASFGELEGSWLQGESSSMSPAESHAHELKYVEDEVREEQTFPESGYISVDNSGEGFSSKGWIFQASMIFDRQKLYSLLLEVDSERAKGVFVTNEGVFGFNKVDGVLTEVELDDCVDSRIEIISANAGTFDQLEQALLDCI